MTDNELIAEFMGFSLDGPEYENRVAHYREDAKKTTLIQNLKYSESWDWLMPVVEKIRILGETSIIPNIAGRVLKDIAEFSIITDRESIYKAVLEFIKWYNSNKM